MTRLIWETVSRLLAECGDTISNPNQKAKAREWVWKQPELHLGYMRPAPPQKKKKHKGVEKRKTKQNPGECNIRQTLWTPIWKFLENYLNKGTTKLIILSFHIYIYISPRKGSTFLQKQNPSCTKSHSITHKRQKVETTKLSVNRLKDDLCYTDEKRLSKGGAPLGEKIA